MTSLLIEVADRIRASLRSGDAVARIGGDEFVVLCGDVVDRSVVQAVAQRIVDTLGEPILIGGREAHVTASIGIAFAEANSTPGELLRQVDLAMYEAKARGKSQFSIFDEEPRLRRPDGTGHSRPDSAEVASSGDSPQTSSPSSALEATTPI